MNKEHTPTPYRLVIPAGYGKDTLIMSGTDIVASMVRFERKIPTAKFIIKACNNHDRLVDLLYEANNQARKMLNRHDPNNINEMEKVNSRAKYLSENFGNNNEPKIVQSDNY